MRIQRHSDTGSFTVADLDNDAVSIVSNTLISTDHTSNAAFGNLVATVTDNTSDDGTGTISWEYSVNDSDLDTLEHGETYTEVWTVTFTDGNENVTQNVTVTITGAGDVLAQDDYGSVMEGDTLSAGDGSSTYGLPNAFGVAGLTNLNDPLDVVWGNGRDPRLIGPISMLMAPKYTLTMTIQGDIDNIHCKQIMMLVATTLGMASKNSSSIVAQD